MNDAALVKMFKALANPNRLRLFEEIRRGESTEPMTAGCSLRKVINRLSIGAPTVSHHLKELVNAGLISTERRGKFVHCTVNEGALDELETYFGTA